MNHTASAKATYKMTGISSTRKSDFQMDDPPFPKGALLDSVSIKDVILPSKSAPSNIDDKAFPWAELCPKPPFSPFLPVQLHRSS